MGKLEFDNLTVLYDTETDYSTKRIKKVKRIERLDIAASVILILTSIVIGAMSQNFVVGLILFLAVMAADIFATLKLMKKISPPHYDFIGWLQRMKSDEIEIGWFNDRYIALVFFSQHGWQARGMKSFLWSEKYKLDDNAKKDEPIHMTIDATKETILITTENKK